MHVGPARRTLTPAGERIAFDVDDFEVHFTVRHHELPAVLPGEVAVASALLPAMHRGETLTLDATWGVTPAFMMHLASLQEIYAGWAAALGTTFTPITVTARERSVTARAGTLSFFSGGVDGLYTALRNRPAIDKLVMLRGIDMQLDNETLWVEAQAATAALAANLGKPLVEVDTNIRYIGYHHGLKWAKHCQAAGLAAVAHLLAPATMLVAATTSIADLAPFGSHPLLDPLWSSADTVLVHDGPVQRVEKLRAIIERPELLQRLRVCWHDAGFNCGRCEKCIRTMAGLTLLGAPTPSFPRSFSWDMLARLEPADAVDWEFFRELEGLERERPHPVARRVLQRIRRRRVLKDAIISLDEALFGGRLRRIRRGRRS